jgi:hypothetical protein
MLYAAISSSTLLLQEAKMLEWVKKTEPGAKHPLRDLAEAKRLLSGLQAIEPAAALNDLCAWLESLEHGAGLDDSARGAIPGLIHESGAAPADALLKQYLSGRESKQMLRDAQWRVLFDYGSALVSVHTWLSKAGAASSAASIVHALLACRLLAKICSIHYVGTPAAVWRCAYSVYAAAETAACTHGVVHLQRGTTTPETELLRLLMLQAGAPDRMPPEQIEAADRIVQRLGPDFTLRPVGVTDNLFCFDPQGSLPPHAAPEAHDLSLRYFGAGMAGDALARLQKQLTAGGSDVKAFGKDIPVHVQLAAVEHLLRCWTRRPAAPPLRTVLRGDLLVTHGYQQIWRQLPDLESATKGAAALGIAEDDDALPEPPETWTLCDRAGYELGVEIPQLAGAWAKCGVLVAISSDGGTHWWIGVIRRMQGELGHSMRAYITVLSQKPLAASLQPQRAANVGDTDFDPASGTLAFYAANAVLLTDTSSADGNPYLLIPLVAWKAGRVYQTMVSGPVRCLRLQTVMKRGDDYIFATFEWLDAAQDFSG